MYKGLSDRLSTSDEMSVGVYASVNVWQCMIDNRLFKKMRVAASPTTVLITGAAAYQITGFAQLHTVLMRISYAQEEHEVLGLDRYNLFTVEVEDVQSRFEEAFAVLRRNNVELVHPLLIPISHKALQRVRWVSKTIFNNLDMIARTLVCSIARVDYNVRNGVDSD